MEAIDAAARASLCRVDVIAVHALAPRAPPRRSKEHEKGSTSAAAGMRRLLLVAAAAAAYPATRGEDLYAAVKATKTATRAELRGARGAERK